MISRRTLKGISSVIIGCFPTTPRPLTDLMDPPRCRSRILNWRSISSNGSAVKFSIVTVYCYPGLQITGLNCNFHAYEIFGEILASPQSSTFKAAKFFLLKSAYYTGL